MTDAAIVGTPQTEEDRTISSGEAAMRLGISKRTLARMVDQGDIDCAKDAQGRRRFRVDDVEELREERAPGGDPAGIVAAATGMVRTQQAYIVELQQVVITQAKLISAENTELRTGRTAMFEATEQAKDRSAERDLARTQAASEEKRKDEALRYAGILTAGLAELIQNHVAQQARAAAAAANDASALEPAAQSEDASPVEAAPAAPPEPPATPGVAKTKARNHGKSDHPSAPRRSSAATRAPDVSGAGKRARKRPVARNG